MTGRLPGTVIALGFVSLFMDVSSEMIHALMPLYLTGVLGASTVMVGFFEGAGEALTQITKLASGLMSDRIGRRKPLLLWGYGLAALTKPVFALAGSVPVALAARLTDRLGKGIRGAPRDALLADATPVALRGAAFGLRQSMDTIGAFVGPLLAMAIMALSGGSIRLVFALAVLPALIAVAILWRAVDEVRGAAPADHGSRRFGRDQLAALGPAFRWLAVIAGLISFARLSEPFLILRVSGAGLPTGLAPLVLVILNLVYAATAWPTGRLSDRFGRRGLLFLSLGFLGLAHATLWLRGAEVTAAFAGVGLWGLHMGLSQGLIAALVADSLPKGLRGTGFGILALVTGLATLAANLAAGWLWAVAGPAATFALGLLATCLTAVLLALAGPSR